MKVGDKVFMFFMRCRRRIRECEITSVSGSKFTYVEVGHPRVVGTAPICDAFSSREAVCEHYEVKS